MWEGEFPFPLCCLLSHQPPSVVCSISKAAGALSSTTDKLEERLRLSFFFSFSFFFFLRWPANVILHTQNGVAISSTYFRGDNLTFYPPLFFFFVFLLLYLTFLLYVFHQVSSLKSKLKKQSTATGSGVARAFMRAQAALFGSYRDALRYKPVRTKSLITNIFISTWLFTECRPHLQWAKKKKKEQAWHAIYLKILGKNNHLKQVQFNFMVPFTWFKQPYWTSLLSHIEHD